MSRIRELGSAVRRFWERSNSSSLSHWNNWAATRSVSRRTGCILGRTWEGSELVASENEACKIGQTADRSRNTSEIAARELERCQVIELAELSQGKLSFLCSGR